MSAGAMSSDVICRNSRAYAAPTIVNGVRMNALFSMRPIKKDEIITEYIGPIYHAREEFIDTGYQMSCKVRVPLRSVIHMINEKMSEKEFMFFRPRKQRAGMPKATKFARNPYATKPQSKHRATAFLDDLAPNGENNVIDFKGAFYNRGEDSAILDVFVEGSPNVEPNNIGAYLNYAPESIANCCFYDAINHQKDAVHRTCLYVIAKQDIPANHELRVNYDYSGNNYVQKHLSHLSKTQLNDKEWAKAKRKGIPMKVVSSIRKVKERNHRSWPKNLRCVRVRRNTI